MKDQYTRDYYNFQQQLRDREDEFAQKEEKIREEKLRFLNRGLKISLEFLQALGRSGLTAAREEILAVLKEHVPEVWLVPEARPLIDFLFQGSK